MGQSNVRESVLAALLLVAVLALFSTFATDSKSDVDAIQNPCWANSSTSYSIADLLRKPHHWTCHGRPANIDADRMLLRFNVTEAKALPRYFLSRRNANTGIHAFAIDYNGKVRHKFTAPRDLKSAMISGFFRADLPLVSRETKEIIVAIDNPAHEMISQNGYITAKDAIKSVEDVQFLLVLVGLAGMLLMPLIFNLAFYRVLREPFLGWHAALTFILFLTICTSSTLLVVFGQVPAMMLSWMSTLLFGLSVSAASMFVYTFIEPGKLHPFLRKCLPYCAVWAVVISTAHVLFPFVARPVQSTIYTAAYAPIMVVFILAMISSLRRGSRSALYQVIGYSPMIGAGMTRLVSGTIPSMHYNDGMLLFYVGCIWEVIFTTLGVTDRLITLRRERDCARTETEVLKRLAETDTLTGLRNRRALAEQFPVLRKSGFHTLALLDLDHFKSVNDRYGHASGDAVLRVVAQALAPNDTIHAYRLGGEEFMLYLSGENVEAEAERRRQAIPAYVAERLTGIKLAVTASMGIARAYDDEGFESLYRRADALLYTAKHGGRNRVESDLSHELGKLPSQLQDILKQPNLAANPVPTRQKQKDQIASEIAAQFPH